MRCRGWAISAVVLALVFLVLWHVSRAVYQTGLSNIHEDTAGAISALTAAAELDFTAPPRKSGNRLLSGLQCGCVS